MSTRVGDHVAVVLARIQAARALVFDFDGTLVDSNSIKRRAFDICFSRFPEHLDRIRDYCYKNNHTPRWEKFRHVYERILDMPYTPAVDRDLHHAYAEATSRQVVDAPEIPGAQSFLEYIHRRVPLALVSSTPHDILLWILDSRRWRQYFKSIQGAPVRKADWLRDFTNSQGYRNSEVLFFGDTPEDAEASRQAKCPFIAVANPKLATQAAASLQDWTGLAP